MYSTHPRQQNGRRRVGGDIETGRIHFLLILFSS